MNPSEGSRRRGAFARIGSSLRGRLPVPARQLAVMMRQLALMVGAGLPLAESLAVLHRQQDHRRVKAALAAVAGDVESGSSLAGAMERRPAVFSPLAVALTASGETGGRLDRSLLQLADEMEKSARIAAQVRGAFAYPAVVAAVGVMVVALILWKVVPVFSELYDGLGAELPLPTRVVVGVSQSFAPFAVGAAAFGATAVLVLRRVRRSPVGGPLFDRFVLGVPLFGSLLLRASVARFCRTLAALTGAGVPVLEGLDIASNAMTNRHLAAAISRVRARVEAGASLSAPLGQSRLFPPMVTQMVAVGERTGELDSALDKVAAFYEEEVRRAASAALPLLEPLLILVLGAVIGGIVIAMYMPIWTLVGRLA